MTHRINLDALTLVASAHTNRYEGESIMEAEPAGHGGPGSMYARGCRCDDCRKANAERSRRQRAERLLKEPPTHGTWSTYINWGCRCEPCRAAASVTNRARRRAAEDKRRKDKK